jgi:hypothetical protein
MVKWEYHAPKSVHYTVKNINKIQKWQHYKKLEIMAHSC